MNIIRSELHALRSERAAYAQAVAEIREATGLHSVPLDQLAGTIEDMPMDHFRCGSCARVWKRCHGTPELCDAGGFWLPGSVTIKEVKAIKFRCLFCGKEFGTVEACNACEESH